MSAINFVNTYPADRDYTYDERIALLRQRKVEQTEEKARLGGADEDDYGVIEQDVFKFELKPNHENGSIYGYRAWSENYARLLSEHPLYCDPLDAFVGKGFLFMERLRPKQYKWNPAYPYDDLKVIFEKYDGISGVDNCHHFTPDLQIGFDLGWGGILALLKSEREKHDETHHEFYDAEIMVVEAIIAFLTRGAKELAELSKVEKNPLLAKNLAEMAEVNLRMATEKPETFREAVQWLCWFSMLSRTYNRGSAGGQLDEMLRPYYERDVALGRLTDEEAVFYLACLFLQDSRYFQLGGPDENGEDMTSRLSYLALEAADKINIACNLTIRVHDKMNEDFFRKSIAYLFKNKQGWPRYSSDNALVDGFMRCGYTKELARRRVAAGCHWMCIPGMEYTMNDTVKVNLLRTFEHAYNEMMEGEEYSTEKLFALYEKHLKIAVDATGAGIMHHLKYQSKSQPELILNLFQHGLIAKGVNITDGGANYYNMCMDGSGLAVVADSFAALEQRIEKEKKISYEALYDHIKANYEDEDGEYIRQLMLHSQRYGGGNSLGDAWAVRVKDLYTALVRSLCEKYKGINFIPGFFSWSNTILLGKKVGATPNGRKSGEPINHGANPCSGFRADGAVTSMCNSIAAVQPAYGNTAPVQLEVDPGVANDEEGIEKMAALVKTIMNTGNTLLNINIIDTDKILEAHKNPFLCPDLVVRVTGFTAYFAMLSPGFRQLVVDRITSVNPRQLKD
ncbi:MAG: formate acetyltransferase [Clostridia bacterium]|nr:formate acetyltransferase [Clostridia bacterium]